MIAVVAGLVASTRSGGDRTAYDVLVGLHVVTAVVGFGAVAVSGAYGAIARNGPARPETAEEVRRYFSSRSLVEYLVLVAPLFGLAAMGVRPGGREFGQLWAVAGIVIWIGAGGILTGVVRPAERNIRAAGPDMASAAPHGRRLMWASAASDSLFLIALLLMVTQPR